jgi:lycopene cyclase domain-containing protein
MVIFYPHTTPFHFTHSGNVETLWNKNVIMGSFSYLGIMLLFTVIPVGVILYKYGRVIQRNLKVLLIVVVSMVLYTSPAGFLALRWNAYMYPPEHNLGIWIAGTILEDYIFIFLVSLIITSVTIAKVAAKSEYREVVNNSGGPTSGKGN